MEARDRRLPLSWSPVTFSPPFFGSGLVGFFGLFLVLASFGALTLTRSASSSASVRAKRASSSSDIRALRPTDGVRPLSGTYHEVIVPPGDAPR